MRPPVLNIANKVAIHSRTQGFKNFWALALSILLINLALHIVLWYAQAWQPVGILSLLSFILLIRPYRDEKKKLLKNKEDHLILKAIALKYKGAKYLPNKGIPESKFIESRLLNNVDFQYHGNQLINIKTDRFSISNIQASHPSAIEFTTPFFDGVLAKKNISNNFSGYILIRPSLVLNKSDIPEVFKKLFRRHMPTDAVKVNTKHQDFDKSFDIYTNNPRNWHLGLQDTFLDQFLTLNKLLLEIMRHEKQKSEYILFTEHSLLKKSPLEISIVNNQIYLGVRNMKLFNIHQDSTDSKTNNIIEKSISIIQTIHSLHF